VHRIPDTSDLARFSQSVAALRSGLRDVAGRLGALEVQLADARRRTEELLAVSRQDLSERAGMARIAGARLLSDSLVLDGSPAERLHVRRIRVGEPVERPFSRWMRTTICVSGASDVQALWDRILTREARAVDGMLRGRPSTILDVPDAVVSKTAAAGLHVSLRNDRHVFAGPDHGRGAAVEEAVVAVPRFTYAFPLRKLRNFSHWLLDCLPQVVALLTVAPQARFLLPPTVKEFQRSTLALAGLSPEQVVSWDGAPIRAGRVLIFESDGRAGGGRPLSGLLEMRRRIAEGPSASGSRRTRRIYVSRRDAKAKRQWATNEAGVEALFESRGFDILCPTDYPLDELMRIFREAAIVAGLNGAGLAHIFFSSPGTHVIVLLTDSLIRWHADESGSRSLWSSDHHSVSGELAALGDSPRFYAHVAAALDQYCHSFVTPDDVPLVRLSAFLDDVLLQAQPA
jgi:capsular polysaccharide biosynthesis protein